MLTTRKTNLELGLKKFIYSYFYYAVVMTTLPKSDMRCFVVVRWWGERRISLTASGFH